MRRKSNPPSDMPADAGLPERNKAFRQCRFRDDCPMPREGEGGFSQSWYPVATSKEVASGSVFGTDFLDGRVVVFRGEDGVVQVLSAFARMIDHLCAYPRAHLSASMIS